MAVRLTTIPCTITDQAVATGMSKWAWSAAIGQWNLIGCNCSGQFVVPPGVAGTFDGQVAYMECIELPPVPADLTPEDDPVVEELPDAKLLELCRSKLSPADQEALSDLLARQGELSVSDEARLDELMALYSQGLTRKARALKEAVVRGLIPRLNNDGG
jgi:hypothetical protein